MARLKVAHTHWSLRQGVVTKRCSYAGLKGDSSAHTLQIEIESKLSRRTGLLEPGFRLFLKPSPLSEWENGYLDGQIRVPDLPVDVRSLVRVIIENADDGTLTISSASVQDASTFIDDLCFGHDMRLVLLDDDELLLDLPIPNDREVYALIRDALM